MRARRGNVLLPFIGMFYFFPCYFFLIELGKWYGQNRPGGAGLGWKDIVLSACCGCPFAVSLLAAFIALAMFAGEMEAAAERCGLGACQYGTGATWGEKISREANRLALFIGSCLLAYIVAGYLPYRPSSVGVWTWGFAAAWQWIYLLLFIFVVMPLKHFWPRFGGYSGDPSATYCHVW